jgi:hypothetical protein
VWQINYSNNYLSGVPVPPVPLVPVPLPFLFPWLLDDLLVELFPDLPFPDVVPLPEVLDIPVLPIPEPVVPPELSVPLLILLLELLLLDVVDLLVPDFLRCFFCVLR